MPESRQVTEDMFELYAQEDLHPALKPYIGQAVGMEVLRHPLVYSVPYSPIYNRMINGSYRHKLQMLEQALEQGDVSRYVFLHERPYRVRAFRDWLAKASTDQLSDSEYWSTLADIWADTENSWQDHELWHALFSTERGGREAFMNPDECEAWGKLPTQLEVYRGTSEEHYGEGFSWTLDESRATWFAKRFHLEDGGPTSTPVVVKGTVRKSDIIGLLLGRNEDEVVALPLHVGHMSITRLR